MARIKKTEKTKKESRNIAYLRVSTQDQDCEKNKADILSFANERNFGQVEFVEEKVSGKVNWKSRKIKKSLMSLETVIGLFSQRYHV
jgi:DNA invertase Pin-like site-specific DNA recombinase